MPRWTGDNVGSVGMHKRVYRARGKASEYDCVGCGGPAEDWAQVHDTDRLDVMNYRPMCTGCHMEYDLGGKKRPAEVGAKISAAKRGVPNPHSGHIVSEETRRRMSEAQSRRWERYREANG